MSNSNYSTVVVKNHKTGQLETVCLETGEVLNGLNGSDLGKYRFNLETAALICQRVREGTTLKTIQGDPAFPSLSVIHYWRRTNATFDEEIKLARKERAEYYHDKVIDLADECTAEREEIALAKFRTDQYKWAAEKGDPGSYGNKLEHSGSNTIPAMIIVTGIKRQIKDADVVCEEISDNSEQSDSAVDGAGVLPALPDFSEDHEPIRTEFAGADSEEESEEEITEEND